MGRMTQPSNLSSRQSSSPSWCMARLRGGALRVPAIDSEFRRPSVVASVAGSLHQIYRRSPTCAVKPMTICSTAFSTTVTNVLHHLLPPPSQASQHYTLRSRRHNLQLSITSTSLIDKNFLHRMLHIDSYWFMISWWLAVMQKYMWVLSLKCTLRHTLGQITYTNKKR